MEDCVDGCVREGGRRWKLGVLCKSTIWLEETQMQIEGLTLQRFLYLEGAITHTFFFSLVRKVGFDAILHLCCVGWLCNITYGYFNRYWD